MKEKFYTILLFSVCLSLSVFGQNLTQTIRGKVTDKDSRLALPFANVVLVNSEPLRGTNTDIDGNFRLDRVPVGRQTLKVTFVGYEPLVVSEIMVGTGKETVLNLEMQEKILKTKEVVINAGRERNLPMNSMASISARSLSVEDAGKYAGGFGDPSRMTASFAGVATADDENNEIVIRGNSPRGMLWRLEGIEIPNPNHFRDGEGASGGGISILSNEVLANSDFFTSAFPAEYGNATSGVFDIRLRKGNTEKREYVFQAGVLGIEAAAEGPFIKGENGSYLVHYRYSTFDLLNKIGINPGDNEIIPRFQDIAVNLSLPTRSSGIFTLFGIGGKSSAGQLSGHDSLLWKYRSDRYEENEDHKSGVVGMTHTYLFSNNKTYLKTVVALTGETNIVKNDSLNRWYTPVSVHKENFTQTAFRMSLTLNHKFNAKNTIRTGIILNQLGFDSYDRGIDWDDHGRWKEFINQDGNTWQFQSFLSWKNRISEAFTLNAGMHYLVFGLNKHTAFEPRLGMEWQFAPSQTLNFGAGLHSRVETISNYLIQVTRPDGSSYVPNENLDFTKAAHAVLGYNNFFTENLRMKAEIYYQYLYNVPVERDSMNPNSAINVNEGLATTPLSNLGKGYNYGLELTMERFFSSSYYFLVTGSLFDSKYRGSDNVLRNTCFNNRYILNVLGGKEFKVGKNKNNILAFNVKLLLRGGYRTTPIDLEESRRQNETVYVISKAYEEQAPDYFRVDFGVKYRKNLKHYAWTLAFDLQNLTDRKNVAGRYFDTFAGEIRKTYLAGRVPVLSFRVEL